VLKDDQTVAHEVWQVRVVEALGCFVDGSSGRLGIPAGVRVPDP
jgi:hypothetical protein